MKKLLLIKYGELTTKKDNRNLFINKLSENIQKSLKEFNIKIIKNRVRMFIDIEETDFEEIISRLQKIFGIHRIVVCDSVNNNIEQIGEKVVSILKSKEFKTFKVETNRSNKNFELNSLEISKQIGAFVLKNINCHVDVHNPDIIVNIEVRDKQTYIYLNEYEGAGGYPVGVQGKGLLMLSGGIDSPVAGYLAMKRGITVEGLYFESPPHTSIGAKEKVITLGKILNEYSMNFKLHVVPFTKLQEEIYKNIPDNYIITIMRRMMYRIAEKYAKKNKFKVIINGESVGQVASQTLSSIGAINSVTNFPVIRPVCCMDKLEIIGIAKKIGTYQTSIIPYEDCCTVFVPKHPIINPDIKRCIEYEQKINYEELIEECVQNIEVIKVDKNNYNDIL